MPRRDKTRTLCVETTTLSIAVEYSTNSVGWRLKSLTLMECLTKKFFLFKFILQIEGPEG